jgi:hypothetical protein
MRDFNHLQRGTHVAENVSFQPVGEHDARAEAPREPAKKYFIF